MIDSKYTTEKRSIGETYMAVAVMAVGLLFLGPLHEYADIDLLENIFSENSALVLCLAMSFGFNCMVSLALITRKLGFKKQGARLSQITGKDKRSFRDILHTEGIAFGFAILSYFIFNSYFLSFENVFKMISLEKGSNEILAALLSINYAITIFTLVNLAILGLRKISRFQFQKDRVPRMPKSKNAVCLGTIGEVEDE